MSLRLLGISAVLALTLGAGCNDDGNAEGSAAPVTVFAAASLTEAFTEAEGALANLDVAYTFAGSQQLVTQIQQGAEGDVFASADTTNMQKLVDAGLVEAPLVFARNTLVIAVERGNPRHVGGLSDLGRTDLAVVLADPSVPVGRYAERVLDEAGVTVAARSLELDVKSALAKVTLGEADATIVYATDVTASGGKAEAIGIPAADNVVAEYPIAVLKDSDHRATAEAFVAAALSGPVQDALRARGFLGPA